MLSLFSGGEEVLCENGARVYQIYFKYWTKLPQSDLDMLQEQGVQLEGRIWFPVVLCLTSHWPFYREHTNFLMRLHSQITNSGLT